MSYGTVATIAFGAGVMLSALAMGNHPSSLQAAVSTGRSHQLAGRAHGNECLVDAWADGLSIGSMIVDTGAQAGVYLPAEIARQRLNLDLSQLPADHSYAMWLGTTVRGATVRFHAFRIGDVTLSDIPALIDDTPLNQHGLIGMGVLKRLHAQLDTDTCTLSW